MDTVASALVEIASAIRSLPQSPPFFRGSDWITLFVALVPAYAIYHNGRIVSRSLSETTAREIFSYQLQHRLRQLNDFYGPIQSLNAKSRALHDQLAKGKPEGWHFLPNAEDTLKNNHDKALMTEILINNDKIDALITEKAGLALHPYDMPRSFRRFQKHHTLVKIAMKEPNSLITSDDDVFPREFDTDIESECKAVSTELEDILAKARSTIDRSQSND